jgi:hypothetical protein
MEVLQAVRFGDGRLLVLAVGVARFRAVRELQAVPYCRADVELLLDAEEAQRWEGLALQAADGAARGLGGGDGGQPELAALMRAVPAAARQAAAAHSLAWLEYELSEARQSGGGDGGGDAPAVIDGSRPGEAQLMGRRLAAIAGNEVMELPFYEPLALAAAAPPPPREAGDDDGQSGGGGASLALQDALAALRPALRRAEAAACTLATSAAAAAVERHLALPGAGPAAGGAPEPPAAGGGGGPQLADPARLNSAAERGVPWQGPDDVLEPEGEAGPGQRSIAPHSRRFCCPPLALPPLTCLRDHSLHCTLLLQCMLPL